MGRYAIILVMSLIILLTYFVISTNNRKEATNLHNIDEFSYKQAKNIANSATQMIVRNLMRPELTAGEWPDFTTSNLGSTGSLMGQIPNKYADWIEWSDLSGDYKIETLERVPGTSDLRLVIAGRESYQSKGQITKVILKENETRIPYWDYAVYAQKTILMNNPNPYIDSYNSDSPDSLWSHKAEFQNAPVGTALPYVDDNYPINRMEQIYGPDPEYSVVKDLPPIELPAGGTPLTIPNANYKITDGVYRIDGNLSVGGNRVLTIEGDVTLYVTGNFTVSGTASIVVGTIANPNSKLAIYLDGNVDVGGTGFVNVSQLPGNLQIYATANCTSLDYRGTSDTHAAIYAPNADVKLYGTTSYFGAIVCNLMDMIGTTSFHYDEALGGDPTLGYLTSFKYYIASWE